MQRKIDLVYLWFDPTDTDWQQQRAYWQEKLNVGGEVTQQIRWLENNELKYALRSAEKFAPWLNHIYIVTGFGQVPSWLNTDNPKISIVSHEQIMPEDAIPTFNSNAIEACVANIPGLSEYFLLACDDMFFGNKILPDYFFDKNGTPIVYYVKNRFFSGNYDVEMTKANLWKQHHIYMFKILKDVFGKKLHKYMPSHNIEPYLKSNFIETREHPGLKNYIEETVRNKFRTSYDVPRWVYTMHSFIKKQCKLRVLHAPKSDKHWIYNMLHTINGDFKRAPQYHDNINGLRKKLPPLFCINKSDKDNFEQLFPDKSKYEK